MSSDQIFFAIVATAVVGAFLLMVRAYRKSEAERIEAEKPKECDVGQATITVTVMKDNVKHDYVLAKEGTAERLIGWDHQHYIETHNIYEVLQRWRERIGKEGMIYVGTDETTGSMYVPLCNVVDVKVKCEKHLVTV